MGKEMASWYTVERGFITCEKTFGSYEEAALYAMAMTLVTGDMWTVEVNFGMDC